MSDPAMAAAIIGGSALFLWATRPRRRETYVLKAEHLKFTPMGEIVYSVPPSEVAPADAPAGTGAEVAAP